ncbi:MAG: DEAD/DEAH box helicase [Zoogloeaceae bacterium]|nr:DEAD/DEAH box helicase [Rhodocyclaceae bacterium]MCP5234973.1 DEAD/DEAH box helicase [Zoogloeaceae bacterium]
MKFADLGLLPELQRAVADAGYTEPTPIQQQAIPIVMHGLDVMGGAQTGTGKTAGFTLPMLHRLARHASTSTSPARHPVRALILAPTRELAMQVHESVQTYGKYLPLRSTCIYGGVDMNPQMQELRRGIEIVVATPGRLLDHVQQKTIQFGQVEILVLDEADRMLDMGFIPDIRRILALLPANRQSLLFSATFSNEIKKLADQMLKNPQLIEVARRNTVSETISHRVHPVSAGLKRNLLAHILRHEPDSQVLVFVDTKLVCSRLAHFLARHEIAADAIHGDKSQQQRTETLDGFKSGRIRVLVATDVAARGLDIDDLPYVINFELPHTAEDYVHRIGRTGRAGRSGNAVSLVCAEERGRLAEIQKLINLEIPQEPIAGFDVEDDFHDGGQRKRRGDKRPRSDKEGGGRGSASRGRTSGRKSPLIAADGFDFSQPYQPMAQDADKLGETDGEIQPPAAVRKHQRPIAFLLGGLGRKPG